MALQDNHGHEDVGAEEAGEEGDEGGDGGENQAVLVPVNLAHEIIQEEVLAEDALIQGDEEEVLALGDGLIVLPNQIVGIEQQHEEEEEEAVQEDDGEVVGEPHPHDVHVVNPGGALLHNNYFHAVILVPAEGGADHDVFVDALDLVDVPVDVEQVALLQAVPAEGHMLDGGDAVLQDHDPAVDIPVDMVVHAIPAPPAFQDGVVVQPVAGEDDGDLDQEQPPDAVDNEAALNLALANLDILAFGMQAQQAQAQPPGRRVCCSECGPGLVMALFYITLFVSMVFGPSSWREAGVVTSSSQSAALVPAAHPEHAVLPPNTEPDPGVCQGT